MSISGVGPEVVSIMMLMKNYDLNKIINEDVLWFFIKLVLQKFTKTHDNVCLIRAFSDFKAFLYILIGGFSVRGCYHIKTPNFPLPCGRGPTSLPS